MPVTSETRIIGGPDLLENVCRAVGANPDHYAGCVVLLVPPDTAPFAAAVKIHTDAPDRKTLDCTLQAVSAVLAGER